MTQGLKQYAGFKAGRIVSFRSAGDLSREQIADGQQPKVILAVQGEGAIIDVPVPLVQYFGHNHVAAGGYYIEKDDGSQAYMPAVSFEALFGS